MFRQILTCLALHTAITLSSPPTSYLLTFHEAHPPLLWPFTTVSQTCRIRDNECCVPFDLELYIEPPRPGLPSGRRPFFVHHAVISPDPPALNENSSSVPNTPINPTHNFHVWDFPDEACRGAVVEQLRQPRDRESARTRGHGEDGISAIGLGDTSWTERWPEGQEDDNYHFPDAIFLDGVRYGSAGMTEAGTQYLFIKDDRTQRVDLPVDMVAKPWYNVRWEIQGVAKHRNASRSS